MSLKFVRSLVEKNKGKVKETDIAVALIWFFGLEDPNTSLSIDEIVDTLEKSGQAKPNKSRLKKNLSEDSRTAKASDNSFKIRIKARPTLDEALLSLVGSVPVKESNSYIPLDLHKSDRKYISKVMLQINGSYDYGFYDCCAVMCRRLLETLILEVYEHLGRDGDLKAADGNFPMFQGLLNVILNDPKINLGRNAKKGLNELKALGDKSAHNRRSNARKEDLDFIRADFRTATEELLHLAKLA